FYGKMTMYLRRLWMSLGAVIVALAAPMAAHAQCAAFQTPVVISGTVDPLGSSQPINAIPATLNITDPDNNAIAVDFQFVPHTPTTMSSATITPPDLVKGTVVVATPPTISVNPPSGVRVQYNGQTHAGSTVLSVTVPAGANIVA